MAVPVYQLTFTRDYPPYAAGELASFPADQAATLFVIRAGTLSSEDQTTIAVNIAKAQALNPQKSVTCITQQNPDGTVSIKLAGGQNPPYGS